MVRFVMTAVAAVQILFVRGGLYSLEDQLPVGGITKYLKAINEVSCLLQCERDKDCDSVMFKLQNDQTRNGECWFVRTDATDKGAELQRLKEEKSIKNYKKVPSKCPTNAACDFGNCVGAGNEYQCGNVTCNFIQGDGIGGPEIFIGYKNTATECINACIAMRVTSPDINGVTIPPAGRVKCYCEKGWAGSNGYSNWKTCKI